MSYNTLYANNIKPIDAKIYYEDGVPYLEYRGMTQNFCNDMVEVYIPKIKLEISAVAWEEECIRYDTLNKLEVTFSDETITRQYSPQFKTIERTMTKAEIEKELGYKVKIVD